MLLGSSEFTKDIHLLGEYLGTCTKNVFIPFSRGTLTASVV
jgi:hypothetical protein